MDTYLDNKIISYSDAYEISVMDCTKEYYKVSRYDKVYDYCLYGYLICQNSFGDLIIAINNKNLISQFLKVRDIGYKVKFIKDQDFNNLLRLEFSSYNAIKAKYFLDFISPASAAKNIKYNKAIISMVFGMGCVFIYIPNTFHLINNLLYLSQNLFKTFLFIFSFCKAGGQNKHDDQKKLADLKHIENEDSYPIYTILLPIYQEAKIAHLLIQSISDIVYPKSKLDVKIIVEDDDNITLKSLMTINLPEYMHIIKVPYSAPRTKPKALNYAMNYAKGEYIVIYDAEDRPEPDQLIKAVNYFAKLPENYSCLQAKLNYYNRNENLLTKLFSMEYSLLFDFLLKGLENLKLPMPLGGTSNHFKAKVLKNIGAWDAYNVTEDADLGIRLHLSGYKTSVLDSYTMEESPITINSWLKQRARWIKGFLQTFIVYLQHSPRSNVKLSDKITIWIFIGLSSYSFLILPWLIITAHYLDSYFSSSLLVINTTYALSYMYGVALTILKKNIRRFRRRDILAFLIWPLYFTLHTIAAYRALYELSTKPFKWNKTEHGETNYLKSQKILLE